MERVHWQGVSARYSGDSLQCVCVCVSVWLHAMATVTRSLSHVSLFIPLSFGHLTETNDSASEMSSGLAHKQVEGGGGRALRCSLSFVFFCLPASSPSMLGN